MISWIQKTANASRETKLFILTAVIYVGAIVGSTIYCYARLDFVRTTPLSSETQDKI